VPELLEAKRVRQSLRGIDRQDQRALAAASGSERERGCGRGLAYASRANAYDDAALEQNVNKTRHVDCG
jgi:hypothetical protein